MIAALMVAVSVSTDARVELLGLAARPPAELAGHPAAVLYPEACLREGQDVCARLILSYSQPPELRLLRDVALPAERDKALFHRFLWELRSFARAAGPLKTPAGRRKQALREARTLAEYTGLDLGGGCLVSRHHACDLKEPLLRALPGLPAEAREDAARAVLERSGPLAARLREYEADRKRWRSLADFVPRWLEP